MCQLVNGKRVTTGSGNIPEESSSFSVNITAHNSNIYNASVSGTLNFNQQRQTKKSDEKKIDEEESFEEESDEASAKHGLKARVIP